MSTNLDKIRQERDAERKELVKRLLEHHGFAVDAARAAEAWAGHRPDFLAQKDQDSFAIEFKEKVNGSASLQGDFPIAAAKGFDSRALSVPRAGLARGALKPSGAPTAPPDAFRMFWFHFEGEEAPLNFDRARARLFGTMAIADLGLREATPAESIHPRPDLQRRQCYYFTESIFSRYRDSLDAVVLSRTCRLLLCINSLSPNACRFRASAMARAFSDSVVDPDRWEKSKIAFVLDGRIDRRNPETCLGYLQQKYHTGHLVALPESRPATAPRNGQDPAQPGSVLPEEAAVPGASSPADTPGLLHHPGSGN
jgi:hypothetical protein